MEIKILYFYGEYCGSCKAFMPTMDYAVGKYKNVEYEKINVEEHPEMANAYRVMSVPQLVFLKDGEIVEHLRSLPTEQMIYETLDGLL